MTTLSLTAPPGLLPASAAETWLRGLGGRAAPGDLWLLSWDGQVLAVVLIARVRDGYVVAWPVDLSTDAAVSPAVRRRVPGLGIEVALWPQFATGLGAHLLHRKIATGVVSERTIDLTRLAVGGPAEMPLEYVPTVAHDEQRATITSDLSEQFQRLCFHEWPGATGADERLDPGFLERHGLDLRDLVNVLGIDTPTALDFLSQNVAPTSEQIAALSAAWGADPAEFTRRNASSAVRELLNPQYKDYLVQVCRRRGVDETQARSLAQEQFALAARTEIGDTTSDRMRAALQRLLEE